MQIEKSLKNTTETKILSVGALLSAILITGLLGVATVFAGPLEKYSANLDGILTQVLETKQTGDNEALRDLVDLNQIKLDGDRVTVEFTFKPGKSPTDVSTEALAKFEAKIISASKRFLLVSIPLSQLSEFADSVVDVGFLHRPYRIYADAVSEGVALVGGNMMHEAGFSGRDLEYGVIDLGFAEWETARNRGELPQQVEARNFTNENMNQGADHGTACAEIVHDFATESVCHLLKIDDNADLENSIDYLLQRNIPVASMSLTWFVPNGDYYGGEDRFCEIVDEAAANGLLMVKSAGNYAKSHYRANFTEQGNDNLHHFGAQTVNIFGSSAQRPKDFHQGEVIGASLVWDAFPVTGVDYDLELVRLNGQQWQRVAISNTRQNGNQPPTEELQVAVQQDGNYGLRVLQVAGGSLNLTVFSNIEFVSRDAASSLPLPAMAAGALTIGAVNQLSWNRDPTPLQAYSSRGPTYDGRIKPDLVAPDAVSTWSMGVRGFSGTSASTPHVAGAAILIKNAFPDKTGEEIKEYLMSTAQPSGEEGPDNLFGSGRLHLTLGEHPEGQTIRVPIDIGTINSALQIADSLDTILVYPGVYFENLNTLGKRVVIGSLFLTTGDTLYIDSTEVDGDGLGSVIAIENGEDSTTSIVGFKITNGRNQTGSGLRILNSSPTIRNCKIVNNFEANDGGGVGVTAGSPHFYDCLISGNSAVDEGGAIVLRSSNASFVRCLIKGNRAGDSGGGVHATGESAPIFESCIIDSNQAVNNGGGLAILSGAQLTASFSVISDNWTSGEAGAGGGVFVSGARPVFDHCTFNGNTATTGGALRLNQSGEAILSNSILYGNDPEEISLGPDLERNQIALKYCDVQGGVEAITIEQGNGDIEWGEGNFDAQPRWMNAEIGDFALGWTSYPIPDTTKSPCIDAGDPEFRRDTDSSRTDIGAAAYRRVPLNAPRITISADSLFFIDAPVADTSWQSLVLWNYGDQVLEVTAIRIEPIDGRFGAELNGEIIAIEPQDSVLISFYCMISEAIDADYQAEVSIESNDPLYGEMTVILDAAALGVEDERLILPNHYGIISLSPNPFNAQTTIRYRVREGSLASLRIYDTFGRVVETLNVKGTQTAEMRTILWDASRMPAGVYLLKLQTGNDVSLRKAVILK